MYEIHSKSDFEAGATLVVTMPEEDIDKKSLYTILSDKPNFLLPFRHRLIDGKIEFTYQIGNRSKITYLAGNKTPDEYITLWVGVLQPLVDGWDWFLNPYSFVLIADNIYYEKNSKSICYIYIPSKKAVSDHEALKSMVMEIEKANTVADDSLTNSVLRALQDFKPREFLQILTSYKSGARQSVPQYLPVQSQSVSVAPIAPPVVGIQSPKSVEIPSQPKPSQQESTPVAQPLMSSTSQQNLNDIQINLQTGGKKQKADKAKVKKEKVKKEKVKKEKPIKEKKEKFSLFGKKKSAQEEIIQGAAAVSDVWQQSNQPPHNEPQSHVLNTGNDSKTELLAVEFCGPKFRYVGNKEHPRIIEIDIAENSIFTIGRFDISVGIQQSNFEFDKKTKAVSRRHTAIERRADGYYIVDLDSSAGTFVDKQKLLPNVPYKLNRNTQVSFGHSGADYTWEE